VGEQEVERDGKHDGRKRTGPTAAHGVGHGDAHRGGGGDGVAFQVLEEPFQVVDRDASPRPAARHAGKIGGMESEFGHPGLHPRGEKTGAAGMGRDRKAADGRFNLLSGRGGLLLAGGFSLFGLFLGRRRRRVVQAEPFSILVADLEVSESRPTA